MRRNPIVVMLMLAVTLLVAGCGKEDCPPCDQGVCEDQVCSCNPHYEGDDCSSKSTTKFIGEWEGGDICGSGSEVRTCRIEETTVAGRIRLSVLGPEQEPVWADVTLDQVDIPQQAYGAATIVGLGALDQESHTLTLDYQIDYPGGFQDHCFTTLE